MSGYLDMDLLRFTTAGSVDDGKSTLIGRLLYDSKAIFDDQLEAVEQASAKRGSGEVDLSLLTDGLRAEREQGITIDVAYRYFATPKRKFIIADTPGHIQYTRNMVTGASTANLAIILVDARKGIQEQTNRHAFIASLLGIPHVVFCINKMDLVGYAEAVFTKLKRELEDFSSKLEVRDVQFLPVSALKGDMVVERGSNMPWYQGPTLMYLLETLHIAGDLNHIDRRFPVQYVVRPMTEEHHDFRGFAGRVAGGVFRTGDPIQVLPGGQQSRIAGILVAGEEATECFAPQSALITLEDAVDVSRGDLIAGINNPPAGTQDLEVMLCWFNEAPLQVNGKYALRHTSKDARCVVKEVVYRMDINTLRKADGEHTIRMNDIGRVKLRTTVPLHVDPYARNRSMGSIILIDESTNATVAAGMIVG
ncbi:MAG TPA: GTP-binding protein [Flavobacteriales bacterium]